MSDVVFLTPSELLAQRANAHMAGQAFIQPELHVIPGALRAITSAELAAHNEAGRQPHEIAEIVNHEWREVNATRLALHATWVAHDYLPGIERRRKAAILQRADEQRRRAAFERLIDKEIEIGTP